MVFIYGGSFRYGSNAEAFYNPEYLLRKNIVYVAMNYRLGAFGFLSLDDRSAEVPGNAGLKDQSLALKWIKENIQHFGGDNNSITIFGESAGGCSVHYHMLSNLSNGLFHKAIPMSGTAMGSWANNPNRNWAKRLALLLGWKEQEQGLLEFLQDIDASKIVEIQDQVATEEETRSGFNPFGPTAEPYVSEQSFFTEAPDKLAENPWSKNVPLLIGGVSDEGLLLYRSVKDDLEKIPTIDYLEKLIPPELNITNGSEKSKQLALKLKEFYFPNANASSEESFSKAIELMGDKYFWHGIHLAIGHRLNSTDTADTFLYRFNVDSKTEAFNFMKIAFVGEYIKGTPYNI